MDIALLDDLIQARGRGEHVALALVVATKGSAPRKPGAALLATKIGRLAGTVGGGLVEARALAEASRLLEKGGTALLKVELLGATASGDEPICGGEALVLVLRVDDAIPFAVARDRLAVGLPVVAVYDTTDCATANPVALLGEKGRALWGAPDPGDVNTTPLFASALRGQALHSADGRFLDPMLPAERLLILGGGHVGRALARAASRTGFDVTIADPRPEFSDSSGLAAGIAVIRDSFDAAVRRFAPRPCDYAVVVSPDHRGDLEAVRSLIPYGPKYLGFIGSRRKTTMALDQLISEGFDAGRVEEICAPIGLDIGAETPEEIAIAICAELIAYRRDGPCLSYIGEERRARRARPYE